MSDAPEPTLFEKIIAGEIPGDVVWQDDQVFAFRDIDPQAPEHVLIIPKRPIPRVGEAVESDGEVLGNLLLAAGKVAEILGVNSTDKGFRLVINNGRDGGEAVPHLHVHLLAGRQMKWPPG